jgi:hypothetical protein
MAFGNQEAFHNSSSRMMAAGIDLRKSNAIVDLRGNVLAYAQTGGMTAPIRFEIVPGAKLYRFGNVTAGVHRVAVGSWWLEQAAFDKLVSFAQVHDLSIGMALVPSGMRLEFGVAHSSGTRKVSFQAARSIG